ncbi:hypothetical protein E8E14_003927 [Neopestalotiopsis sp. 37M]|nr:hypothetical protein E8E14_003927 [Neopestalotiopsis sp. 37M]
MPPRKEAISGTVRDGITSEQRLFEFSMDTSNRELHFLAFRGLQRMNILQLQYSLSKYKKQISEDRVFTEGGHPVQLKQLLHDYANAIRDYQYIRNLAPITGSEAYIERLDLEQAFPELGDITHDARGYRRLPSDSAIPTDPLRDFLKGLLPPSVTYSRSEKKRRSDEYLAKQPPEEVVPIVDRLARFIVAFLGGSSLVVPMLIMRLPGLTLAKSLITVSVAVLIFAIAMSILFRASNIDTMAATATYAAVLVVFVGTSS